MDYNNLFKNADDDEQPDDQPDDQPDEGQELVLRAPPGVDLTDLASQLEALDGLEVEVRGATGGPDPTAGPAQQGQVAQQARSAGGDDVPARTVRRQLDQVVDSMHFGEGE